RRCHFLEPTLRWQFSGCRLYAALQYQNSAMQQPIRNQRVGPIPEHGATRAQTRTNDRETVALSPPLVDAAPLDRSEAWHGTVVGPIRSPYRTDGLRIESRRVADVQLRSEKAQHVSGARSGSARVHAVGGELRSRRGVLDACGALRFHRAAAGADASQQSQDLLQLVPPGRHRAGPWRGALDPPDDREDDWRARRRSPQGFHHGTVRR